MKATYKNSINTRRMMTTKKGLAFIILFLSVLVTNIVNAQNPNPPTPTLVSNKPGNAIYLGESADLVINNYDPEYKYQWYRKEGQNEILLNGGAESWYITVNQPGIYLAYAINRNDPGYRSFASITITSNGAVAAPVVISNQPDNRLPRGQWGTLTITNYNPNYTYHWYIGTSWEGDFIGGGVNLQTIGINRGGTFTVYAMYAGQTIPGQIFIDEMPEIPLITASQTNLCNGATAVLTIANYDPTYIYNWYKGNDYSTGQYLGDSPTLTVSDPGNYICYSIDRVQTWKNSRSNSIAITTGSSPAPLTIAPATSTLPVNTSKLTLMAAYGNVTWYRDGQSIGTGVSIETDQPGNYTAQSVSSCGTTNSNTVNVTKVNGLLHVSTNTYLPLVAESSATGSITLTDGFSIPAGANYRVLAISDPLPPPPPPLPPPGTPVFTPGNQNYLLTRTPRIAGITDPAYLESKNIAEVNQEVQYFDGLGRPAQTVQIMGSPLQKDLIQPFAYDVYGRETKKYQPYVGSSVNGSYQAAALTSQAVFYNAPTPGILATTHPYAETRFEASPLNREVEQGAPGAPWQIGTGHTVTTAYGTIGGTEVRKWLITPTGADGSVRYTAGELFKTTTTDEDGNPVIEYKDKEDRVVAKRLEPVTGTFLTTFYVYDDLGNLRYVIPPGVGTTVITEGNLTFDQYVYAYRYDERNRVIEKKLPGKDWEYTVYNKLDQVVATQDGPARGRNEWDITKYDGQGRVIMTALWNNNNTAISREGVKSLVYAAAQWETRASNADGYTSNAFPVASINVRYTLNYYDDYNFTSTAIPVTYTYPGASVMTRGLLTGTKTNVMQQSNNLLSVFYYDNEGRNIKTFRQHYLGSVFDTNNYDEIVNTYNFSDELTSTTRKNYAAVGAAAVLKVTVSTEYEYDHTGRKIKTWETVDNGTRVLLARQNYNEVDQLSSKQLHSENSGTTFLQSINYGYNERGWLKESTAPLFAIQLKYNDGSTPRWNGDVTNQYWGTPGSLTKNYAYTYDRLHRLTAGTSSEGYTEQGIDYDNMGNILHLTRSHPVTGTGTSTYIYTGNRMSSITGLSAGTYAYDANGSITFDSRNDVNFAYHKNGALKSAIGSTKNIRYTYSAEGNKLQKIVTLPTNTITDYIDGITYVNGAIESIDTEEGRLFKQTNGGGYTYEYALKDHLGNNRVFFDKDGNGAAREIQTTNYYPFGFPVTSHASAVENKYLYNGKELQDELKFFDYGARFYDPVVARWTSIDPMAEEYDEWSPYNYTLNNPATNIDPNGMWTANAGGLIFGGGGDELNYKKEQIGIAEARGIAGDPEKPRNGGVLPELVVNVLNENKSPTLQDWGNFYGLLFNGNISGAYNYNMPGEAKFVGLPSGALANSTINGVRVALNGSKNSAPVLYTVYKAVTRNGKVYWGMTKDFAKRAAQHGERFVSITEEYVNIGSKEAARGLEQLKIDAAGGIGKLENGINSISIKNPQLSKYYREAIRYLKSLE